MRKFLIGSACAVGLLGAIAGGVYNQVLVFVVHPMVSKPQGATLIMWRTSQSLNFVDSADAICARAMGGATLLCRAVVISATVRDNTTLLTLPYSATLEVVLDRVPAPHMDVPI